MEQLSLNLTLKEINQILDTLGQMPYVNVYQLIDKIKAQAEAQIHAQEMRNQQMNNYISSPSSKEAEINTNLVLPME